MKPRQCDECANFLADAQGLCMTGHKPRFYLPRKFDDVFTGNYGYKRKCDDFLGSGDSEEEMNSWAINTKLYEAFARNTVANEKAIREAAEKAMAEVGVQALISSHNQQQSR